MDRGPLDRWRPRLFLAVALAVVVTFGTLGASHWQPGARDVDALGLLLALAGPVVLLTLPRRPVLAVLLAVGAVGAYLALGYAWGPALGGTVGVLVMVLLTGPAGRARVLAWSGAALMWGVVVGAAAVRDDGPRVGGLLAGAAWTTVALLVATAVRERLARAAAWRAAREDRERTAVATERLRIARELHDVLAHSLSAINVQAGVGLHLLDRDVEQARSALSSIKATSRDALDEVRAVLGVVRGEGDADGGDADGALAASSDAPEPRTPTWDLAALPRLAEPLAARGATVRVDVDPALLAPGAVPPHLAGVAYRVVQEAVTNVGRHAPRARTVVVRVAREEGGLRVVVEDDGGRTGPRAEAVPGYGLRGMRERVEGAGGTLDAGPGAAGFAVVATIPLPADLSGAQTAPMSPAPDNSTPATDVSGAQTARAPQASDDAQEDA
ncbi:sensor histidine kinase [Isoptericola sp. NPDC019693]|uniref:sensor histidine kinase n=1 Tax=Isoptericola sp. NPDC019693 TaxID=3364009 RepID=UPI0037B19881